MRRVSLLLWTILFFVWSSVAIAGTLFVFHDGDVIEGKYKLRDSKVYVPVEVITPFAKAFTFTKTGDAGYIVNARKDIAFLDGSTGNVTLNFLKDFPNGCFTTQNGTKTTLMVDLDFALDFLGIFEYHRGGELFLGKKFPVLTDVKEIENGLDLVFDGDVVIAMATTTSEGTGTVLELSPVDGVMEALSGEVEYDAGEKTARLHLGVTDDKNLRISALGRSLRISFGPPPGYLLYEKLEDGLVWYRKAESMGSATVTLNVLEIDPRKFDVELELAHGTVGGGEKVTEMVARTGAVAGLNGGYFDPSTMSPIGFIVKDGRVLHLPFSIRPVFLKTKDGRYQIRRISYEMNVRLGKVLFYVKGVNTPAKGDALLFTPEYGRTIPLRDGFEYFVANDNWIVAKGYIQHARPGTYVFMVSEKYADLLKDVKVGDPFRIIEIGDLGGRTLDFAVEGGPFLVQNGSPVPDYAEEKALYSSYVTESYAPRTVVGTTNTGKIVFMTISGEKLKGPNYDGLVDLVMRYDLKDAMALDGGGSSVLVIDHRVVNKDPKKEIPVPTGLLVFERE